MVVTLQMTCTFLNCIHCLSVLCTAAATVYITAFRNECILIDSYPQTSQHYQFYVAGTDLCVTKYLLVQTAEINSLYHNGIPVK